MSTAKPVTNFSKKEKLDELWRRGVLAPFLLHPTQKLMYEAIKSSKGKKFVINSSRRLGKSYMLCVIAIESAIQNPNYQIKFAAPTQRAVRKIIAPLMRQILETCPKHLRPKYKSQDGVYEFNNGSEIHIAGSEMGQADGLRGTACDLALVDEAAFASDLEYVIESILMPQTLTRPNARIIMASTPPVSPDHAFLKYATRAMHQGDYARFTIHDNPMLSAEQIAEYMEEAGGEASTTWRREYLAEFVTDKDSALFPEADEESLSKMVADINKPPFFNSITAIDLGYLDFTGVLFAYYDFLAGKVVIEDEILINKATSATIIDLVRAKELELWATKPPKSRVVDGNALAIADMNQTHRFHCHPPEKSDLSANINRVRMDLNNQAYVIHPRCVNLISQLKYATWDKSRTKFSRSSEGGHWDLIAALIYLAKHIDRQTNPIPADFGYDQYSHFGYPRKHKNTAHSVLFNMFVKR